jgi:hypothetical protein
MSQMHYFTAEEVDRVPFWENYLVRQAIQASLGTIPRHALAVGLAIHDREVVFHFQLPYVSEEDEEDMKELLDNFETIVEQDVHTSRQIDIREERRLSQSVAWIFLSHS